jgi:hypothetical protein
MDVRTDRDHGRTSGDERLLYAVRMPVGSPVGGLLALSVAMESWTPAISHQHKAAQTKYHVRRRWNSEVTSAGISLILSPLSF